ncbi:family 43 glycosylhydrolase, partial [candidate division KSB1 bacterium]|nr:family 43 glycosylhydrolase [candidate division KSB1 bacterium]
MLNRILQVMLVICFAHLLAITISYGQSASFRTFINPVIPGDHPDPTLTKIGACFYTSGSSFNPTPKIYRSTDLVHWQVIAQPVAASWSQYGNSPGGGIWGGHMVLYNGVYWHFFGRGGGSMYFVTAAQPEGPWSAPTRMNVPSGVPGLGVDNSIFIDEDSGKWYLLTKAGQENNHI